MRFLLTGAILMSLIAVSVFGFIGLNQSHQHQESENCLANVAQGVTCPVKDGIFAFAVFHIKALKGLSQAVFFSVSPIFLIALLLFVISLSVAVFWNAPKFVLSKSYFKKNYGYKIRDVGPGIISWLAYHEHSPSFSAGA